MARQCFGGFTMAPARRGFACGYPEKGSMIPNPRSFLARLANRKASIVHERDRLRRFFPLATVGVLVVGLSAGAVDAQQSRRRSPTPQRPVHFRTTLTANEMKGKQAVVETAMGTFVIQLLPDAAPNHVGYMIKLARDGAYDHTTFHRAVKHGIIQGGDPLSRDPEQTAKYGTGGLGVLDAEISGEKMTA